MNENEIIENCKSDGDHGSEIESDEKKNDIEVEVVNGVKPNSKPPKRLPLNVIFDAKPIPLPKDGK